MKIAFNFNWAEAMVFTIVVVIETAVIGVLLFVLARILRAKGWL